MEHRIAAALVISGEQDSPAFTLTLDKAVLQVKGSASVIAAIREHFGAAVNHRPSPAPEVGGFDHFDFQSETKEQRPARVREVLNFVIPRVNEAFESAAKCLALSCRNACYDPITSDAIERAVKSFTP